jgi:hypothetical protein
MRFIGSVGDQVIEGKDSFAWILEEWKKDKTLRGYTRKYGFGSFFLLDNSDEIVRWGHTGEEDGVNCRL